jgi:phospholipid N-methyltransferase
MNFDLNRSDCIGWRRTSHEAIDNSKTLAGYWHFVYAALLKQRQTGAILPSQRFLIAKMIAPVPEGYCGEIIELGAGNGTLTRRLAVKCPRAQILACEINPTLAAATKYNLACACVTGRVQIVCDSAQHLLSERNRRKMEKADFIISGIPIGNFGRRHALKLINAISDALAPGGMYIQFQYFLADRTKIRRLFKNLCTVPVFLNVPPAVIYYARK